MPPTLPLTGCSVVVPLLPAQRQHPPPPPRSNRHPASLTPGLQDALLPSPSRATTATPPPTPPGRRLIMLRDLDSIGETHLMAASVQLTHLLLTPINLTPHMMRRRVGIACIDESVWASLFTSSADRTYLDTSTVPPQWSVTLASTQRDGSPVVMSSDVCDASTAAPSPSQTSPKDNPKENNKRQLPANLPDARRARPP